MSRVLRFPELGAPLAAALLSACVSVTPLSQLQSASEENLVRIGDSLVYTEQAGQGDPVLLIHGFGASTYSWRHVIPLLAEHFRVVALDLYGFGWTDRPDDWRHYTRDGQVNLVLAVMDTLEIESAHIIGHSYGGSISMALAADHPDRLQSMVLVDAAAVDYPVNRRKWFAGISLFNWIYVRGIALRTDTVERVMYEAYENDSMVTDELVQDYLDRLRVQGAAVGFRGLTRPLPDSWRPRKISYQEIAVPTLVLWGGQDRLIAPDVGRYHTELFPDARFVEIEAAGHAPMEEQPNRFVDEVLTFLEAVAKRSRSARIAGASEHLPQPLQR